MVTYVKPISELSLEASGAVGVPGLKAGIKMELTIVSVGLPMAVAYNMQTKRFCSRFTAEP
jgi:hypothetical protein